MHNTLVESLFDVFRLGISRRIRDGIRDAVLYHARLICLVGVLSDGNNTITFYDIDEEAQMIPFIIGFIVGVVSMLGAGWLLATYGLQWALGKIAGRL